MLECWALFLCVCIFVLRESNNVGTNAANDLDTSIRMSMARPIGARSLVSVRVRAFFILFLFVVSASPMHSM